MTKLRKNLWSSACGPRVLAIFLLLAGWALAGVPRADAQIPVPRDLTVHDAGPELSGYSPLAATGDPKAVADFSPSDRLVAILTNPLLGLGSYSMRDWGGGVTITVGYGIAAGLIVWELLGFEYEDENAGIPGAVGIGVAGLTTLFGILRPIFYHRPGSRGKAAAVLSGADIAVIPAVSPLDSGIKAVRLSYNFQF